MFLKRFFFLYFSYILEKFPLFFSFLERVVVTIVHTLATGIDFFSNSIFSCIHFNFRHQHHHLLRSLRQRPTSRGSGCHAATA